MGIGVSHFFRRNTMIDKIEKKSFLRFVDTASQLELERKLAQTYRLMDILTEPEVINDARWMISEIILEMDARFEPSTSESKMLEYD
jgi:hypothetical protein